VNEARLRERFPRCSILVVGDFNQDLSAIGALHELGARIVAAGLASADAKRELRRRGIDAAGIVRSRPGVLEAALDRLGLADAVLFGAGDWAREREEILERERELAAADGRSFRPLISPQDSRYDFAGSLPQLAAFALARAAGADFEAAKQFSERYARGHTNENPRSASGRRGRPQPPARRRAR
jgi:hypothetical protein